MMDDRELYFPRLEKILLLFSIVSIESLPRAAAVQCAIIKPELSPPSSVKNAGKPLMPLFTSRSIRHSLKLLIS